MRRVLVGVTALWIACAPAPRGFLPRLAPDEGSIAVHCGALIAGVSDHASGESTVVIRRGRIVSIVPGAGSPSDLPTLELGDHTCLPGLIDMHTHLTDRPEDTADLRINLHRSDARLLRQGARNAEATLRAGFTTVRNLGAYVAGAERALRDAIDAGRIAGPRMQIAGGYLTIPGGGGDLSIPGIPEGKLPARVRGGVSRGPEQFAANARKLLDGGADLLKVIASGAVLAYRGEPGEPEMTQAEIGAVVQVGHAAGRKVAAHAHGARSIIDAISAGVDTIEHASLIDDAGIELARTRHIALSMDIYNGDYIDQEGRRHHWPADFLRKNRDTTELQRQSFTRAHAAGVPIVFGTDAGVFPHGDNARQFALMVARGMTPMEAIRSATSVAAAFMGWSDRVGGLQPGRFGDLIAVRGDPLADVRRLERIDVVIKGGLVVRGGAAASPPQ